MKLLRHPANEQNCLVYAAAMILEIEPDEIFNYCGHRGQDIWWRHAAGDNKKRGFHIQEIIDFTLSKGMGLCPLELYPRSSPAGWESRAKVIWDHLYCKMRFVNTLQDYRAILITPHHALAWDNLSNRVYDPNGLIRKIEGLDVIEAWLLLKSNQI